MKVCAQICHPPKSPPEGYPCGKPPTLFEDGKDWCYEHAPSAARARATAQRERWNRQGAIHQARLEIARREAAVLRAASDWFHDTREIEGLRLTCAALERSKNALQALLASKDAPR